LRPGRARSSPTTTQGKILPMPWRPVASSPPPMISPTGCGSWSAAKFSMPTISADGSTALNRRIQASRPEIRVWDHSDDVWAQQFVFSRRRDARLQLLHGLRSGQRRNADRLDQPDHLTRWPADGQLHHAENSRPDLYGVATSAEPVRRHAEREGPLRVTTGHSSMSPQCPDCSRKRPCSEQQWMAEKCHNRP